MVSPCWSRIAASKAAALARRRVFNTTRKPSLAKRWARAPPIPQRAPTGRSLSSTSPPWASLVLRPAACHLEGAATMTATGRLVVMTVRLLLDDAPSGRQEPGGTSAPSLPAVGSAAPRPGRTATEAVLGYRVLQAGMAVAGNGR